MLSATRLLVTTILLLFAYSSAVKPESCSPVHTFTGSAASNGFGRSVSSAGDINNDGYDDIIVGEHGNNASGNNAGRAYVFSGLTGDTLFIFTGEAAGDGLGQSVALAGDVNKDGYPDLIVSAHGFGPSGAAYVFSGLDGDTLHVFYGTASLDQFGRSVSSAGDVNNDGYADLIIGAHRNDFAGSSAGAAYVYSGLDGAVLHVFTGASADDLFGYSVASAGDVNNDGYDDLIIGATWNDGGFSNGGRAYVFSGLNGDTLHIFTGEATNDEFGQSVASAGDVNNDGYDDLIIGAWLNDAGGSAAGRAYLFSGLDGDTLSILTGQSENIGFGYSVAPAGDVDKDGFADFIVGSRTSGPSRTGQAFVFSGKNGDTLFVFSGELSGDLFGNSVAPAGDVNSDGFIDFIIGANGNDAGGTSAGRAYVYSGAPESCCCRDLTGNIDCDPNSVVDIADLTVLIDHLFISLDPLCCREEGNVDGDLGAVVDIADLTFLIDHLFISLVATSVCP